MTLPDYSRYDDCLTVLRARGPLLTNGLINHAPMVAEAFSALGEADVALDWTRSYESKAQTREPATDPVNSETWQDALGAGYERAADWRLYFSAEIDRLGWKAATDLWCARLAPGFATGAVHGIIRVGHAVRALAHGETDARKQELADALGLWASAYRTLRVAPSRLDKQLPPATALPLVPRLPPDERPKSGAITAGVKKALEIPGFPEAFNWLDMSGRLEQVGVETGRAFAEVFLAQVNAPYAAIVFTHAITGVGAVLNIAPHVCRGTTRILLRHGWHAGCALVAVFADDIEPHPAAGEGPESPEDIVAGAIAHGDDHVIKLSEACLSLYHASGDELFLRPPRLARAVVPKPA